MATAAAPDREAKVRAPERDSAAEERRSSPQPAAAFFNLYVGITSMRQRSPRQPAADENGISSHHLLSET